MCGRRNNDGGRKAEREGARRFDEDEKGAKKVGTGRESDEVSNLAQGSKKTQGGLKCTGTQSCCAA